MNTIQYGSEVHAMYEKKIKYYKKHPLKYIEDLESAYNLKLFWYQKIALLLFHCKDEKERKRMYRVVNKYLNK